MDYKHNMEGESSGMHVRVITLLVLRFAGGAEATIGFVHNFLEYAPQYPEGWSSYYIQPICNTMQTIWANQVHCPHPSISRRTT